MNITKVPKKVAKVVARESLETIKKAGEQITATGEYSPNAEGEKKEGQNKPSAEEQKAKIEEVRAKRRLMAYQTEAQDMARYEKQKEEQERVQQEQIEIQKKQNMTVEAPPQITSIPKRGLQLFKKGRGKNVEQRKPPSG
ncbi:MAG TPA: hypothetical protein VF185_00310 [Patescibacteria group bacterium]